MLIDTHAHIDFSDYDLDRDDMMTKAFAVGVRKILHPCCRISEIPTLIEFAEKYNHDSAPILYAALGVHPTEYEVWSDDSRSVIEKYLHHPKIRAIGETGLDYYHCKELSQQIRQREVFQEQIQIALDYKLPLIIHCRDAWEDTYQILARHYPANRNSRAGVMHCYTGDLDFAKNVIERGFYISWSGVLTFKKNNHFREIASHLPIDRIVIETDCPFLAPQAHRGKRNEPAYVREVAETLALAYQVSIEDLEKQLEENSQRLFEF